MSASFLSSKGGIVFDLDGTLADSAPDILAALNRLLVGYGRANADLRELRSWLGDGISRLVERAFETRGGLPEGVNLGQASREYRDLYSGHTIDETVLFPNVEETLRELQGQGYSLGVCTNKAEILAIEVLEGLGIHNYFSAILGGDTLDVCKPDPAHILKTLERMGADPIRAVMVGDTETDVNAAKNSGVPVILTSFGYAQKPMAEMGGDAIIDDFLELPQLAQKFMNLSAKA